MRVLILGGGGMLGHKFYQAFRPRFDTWTTLHRDYRDYAAYGLYDPRRVLDRVDASDYGAIVQAFARAKPDCVVNCIGIIKQRPAAKDPLISIALNSLFPHQIAALCRAAGVRLIHISTDCVFSGSAGRYTEADVPDPQDLYDRSKLLGEVDSPGTLTVRTSIIGRELDTTNGLVEWFLANRGGAVKGYERALWSGFTTIAIARILTDVIEYHRELSGIRHVSSDPIDKYHLLSLVRDAFDLQIDVQPDRELAIDRSLDSSAFRAETGIKSPTWREMVEEMAADPSPYDRWRRTAI
jgi:dTDP-4-dehydrorhamnose reductase